MNALCHSRIPSCIEEGRLFKNEIRRREDGHDVEQWLRAEEEIKQTRRRRVAA